jgi:urocanate hydratase
MTERAEDSQTGALRAFTLLSALRPDWGGALVVCCGLGPGGSALSFAANVAGAGCLAIDARADVCRAALHSGASDFVVNTVDEALRVLKNEIRQRRPVSVGLTLDSTAALVELLDRGVLPELFAVFRRDADLVVPATATWDRAMKAFKPLGTVVADLDQSFSGVEGILDARTRLAAFTNDRGLTLESVAFDSAEQLRVFDGKLLQIIPTTDPRHRWCAAAPRIFHRERPHRRVVFLTSEELGQATADLK